MTSFYVLQVSFEQIYYAFAKKPDKLFWARLKEEIFAFVGKWLEHMENREFCVFIVQKFWLFQPGKMNAIGETMSSWKYKLVVNTKTINTYKNLQMLHSPFSTHFCFPLGPVKPCFVSERVTRADPKTVHFSFSNKILNFLATNSHPNFIHFVREVWPTVFTFRVP